MTEDLASIRQFEGRAPRLARASPGGEMAKRLLLADDSVTIQKVVGISFASEDIEITTVDNGSDAVERAREIRPDIILADVVMPGLSGYEVCEAVKKDPALAHVPVILLTGTFEAFDANRAEQVGAEGHVSKPFEAQTLVDRVKEYLASAPAPSEATQVIEAAPLESEGVSSPQAFDFSDDGSELSAPSVSESLSGEPLEFDESDAAFSFDEEAFAAAVPTTSAPPPAPSDATVVLPGSNPADEAPVEPRDLARATLIDPDGARGFDVSSSDLGPPPSNLQPDPVLARLEASGDTASPEDAPRPYGADPEPSEPHNPFESPPPPPVEVPSDLLQETPMAEIDPSPLPPPIDTEPLDELDEDPVEASFEGRSPAADAWPERTGNPFETGATTAPLVIDTPAEVEAPTAGDRQASEPTPAPAEVPTEEALAQPVSEEPRDLAPAIQQELSDTLEKIAWDAFGPVTETIVKQALERIEQVVWEVVPRLAETLIQEEIRRLQDSDPEE